MADEIDLVSKLEAENKYYVMPYSAERHLVALNSQDEYHLVIEVDGKVVGFVLLAGLQNPNKSLELRRIIVGAKGKGIGSKVILGIQNFCFLTLGFHRLWLDVFEDNNYAKQLYHKLGFVEEGILRDAHFDGQNFISLFVMSILAPEWNFRRNNKKQFHLNEHPQPEV